jgi:hypothetical protein
VVLKPTPPRVEGCAESLPGISMSVDAHYSIPRWWEKLPLGRVLTDRRIAFYQRRGRYGRQLKVPGNTPLGRLVYSA